MPDWIKNQRFWLNQVTEAQPVLARTLRRLGQGRGSYVTPILALIVLGVRLRRHSNASG
jgi:hypothetical protein